MTSWDIAEGVFTRTPHGHVDASSIEGLRRLAWRLAIDQTPHDEALAQLMRASEAAVLSGVLWAANPTHVRDLWEHAAQRAQEHATRSDLWAATIFWRWTSSGARLRVALALAELARAAGSFSFTASVRRIAERAGVGWSGHDADTRTARSALDYLCNTHLVLRVVEKAEPQRPRTEPALAHVRYTLTPVETLDDLLPTSRRHPITGTSELCLRSSGVTRATELWLHPIFEEAALGMSACQLWVHMHGASAQCRYDDLRSALGWTSRRLGRQLALLHDCGMVRFHAPTNTWNARCVQLDAIAEAMGVSSRHWQRSRAFDRQRQGYNGRFARLDGSANQHPSAH